MEERQPRGGFVGYITLEDYWLFIKRAFDVGLSVETVVSQLRLIPRAIAGPRLSEQQIRVMYRQAMDGAVDCPHTHRNPLQECDQ